MKNTLKKVIAFLLVFSFVFAFAACNGDDDKETTTAAATTAPGDTTAEATTAPGDTTIDATTVEGGTTAAGTTVPGQTTTAAAAVNAPVGAGMAQVIEFYNQYGNAMKSYKGKVTVAKFDGTVSQVNFIKFAAITKGLAEDMLPNDYKDKGSKIFVNGVSGDTKLGNWLPRGDEPLSSISPTGPNGVKSATCTASGTGCKIVILMNDDMTSGATALTDKPTYVSKGMETLDIGPDDLGDFKLKSATVNYTGCKIDATFDNQGRLLKLEILTPANIKGDLAYGSLSLLSDTDVTGSYKGTFTFTY